MCFQDQSSYFELQTFLTISRLNSGTKNRRYSFFLHANFKYLNIGSGSRQIWRFGIFAQILKLRGLRPYYMDHIRGCFIHKITQYVIFLRWLFLYIKFGLLILFSLYLTHAILTPVIFDSWVFF